MKLMVVDAPIGPLTVVGGGRGLRAVLFHCDPVRVQADVGSNRVLEAAAEQLAEYFAGERTLFDIRLDLVGTPFQQEVWRALASIPYGTTVSYGEQARRLGRPTSARAVGAANGRNPLSIVLPCHRVVGARGELTGYGGGLEVKRALLEHEARVVAQLA